MPIYRYQCGSCKETRDYLVKMGETPVSCDECGKKGADFKRIYDGAGFAVITSRTVHRPDGHTDITVDRSGSNLEEMARLEPGIVVRRGIDENGKGMINVDFVREDNKPSHGFFISEPYSIEEVMKKRNG